VSAVHVNATARSALPLRKLFFSRPRLNRGLGLPGRVWKVHKL
jgi:hypothetical protein